jgi:hypothetical protein
MLRNNVTSSALQVEEAPSDAALMAPRRLQTYCLVAPIVKTWHSLTLVANNLGKRTILAHWASTVFGMVDLTVDKLFTHLYTEGQGQKGGNNVAPLIMKILKHINILNEDEAGRELSIVMDNCGEQNKKNPMVLRLALYLVEAGFFETVNLIFFSCKDTPRTLLVECSTPWKRTITDPTVTPS